MLAVWVPSLTWSVPPELVPLNVGVWMLAKLMSAKSMLSLPVIPATVPEKLAELSSFRVPVPAKKVAGAADAVPSSSVAPALMMAGDELATVNGVQALQSSLEEGEEAARRGRAGDEPAHSGEEGMGGRARAGPARRRAGPRRVP